MLSNLAALSGKGKKNATKSLANIKFASRKKTRQAFENNNVLKSIIDG